MNVLLYKKSCISFFFFKDENKKLNETIKNLQEKERSMDEEHAREIEKILTEKKIIEETFQTDLENQRNDLLNSGKHK